MNTDDAINIAPHIHKIIEENGKVRILDVTVPPGAVAQMHIHPANVSIVLQGGTLIFTNDEGVAKEVTLKQNSVLYSGPSKHQVENKSGDTVQVIQIELK